MQPFFKNFHWLTLAAVLLVFLLGGWESPRWRLRARCPAIHCTG